MMSLNKTLGLSPYRLATVLRELTKGNAFWQRYLAIDRKSRQPPFAVHIAVLVEPYLSYILQGKKTEESRFSMHRIPPFGQVKEHDVLLLKRASGPIVAICQVTKVWSYRLLPATWNEIRDRHAHALCAEDPMFWESRQKAEYATLMRIANVVKIPPLGVDKRDRRGWVVLCTRQQQRELAMNIPT
jgi:hypothetical protein